MGEMGYGGAEYLGIGEGGEQDGEVGRLGVGLRMEGKENMGQRVIVSGEVGRLGRRRGWRRCG